MDIFLASVVTGGRIQTHAVLLALLILSGCGGGLIRITEIDDGSGPAVDGCAAGVCPPGAPGEPCTLGSECDSGLCVQGVCGRAQDSPCDLCDANATCNANGDPVCVCNAGFVGTGIHCEVDPCVGSPCANGSECVPLAGGQHVCRCAPGFAGRQCEVSGLDCVLDPCQNEGACVDASTGVTCACPLGFAGFVCELPVTDCALSPCQHGGTCVQTAGGYACDCEPGYTGNHCETDVDECLQNPCANGGTCVNELGGFACNCAAGFAGATCESDIDDCADSPCLNGGSCLDGVDSFTCACPVGYAGDLCETVATDCSSAPCVNGGVCTDTADGYACACPPGLVGGNCALQAVDCTLDPCLNGAECADWPGGYLCNCALGFSGDHCELAVETCTPDPCTNGGACIVRGDATFCACPSGFAGALCEEIAVDCTAAPCLNGGVCSDVGDAYACACPDAFAGGNCEQDVDECQGGALVCESNERCVNAYGTASCECLPGFVDEGEGCVDVDECQLVTAPTCAEHATCVNLLGTAQCVCDPGYEGDGTTCTDLDECAQGTLSCGANASCVNADGFAYCACASGYEGDGTTCADIDDCTPDPCLNGGVCTDGVGVFSCACSAGYEGSVCEVNTDDCTPNPCLNGGECVDGVDDYACICRKGFDGPTCAINLDECDPNPCRNGGVCSDGVNSFSCACPLGYAEPTCEVGASCSLDTGCSEEQYCDGAVCIRDGCTSGAERCLGGQVSACLPNGSGETIRFDCVGSAGFDGTCIEIGADQAVCTCQADWDCPEYTTCEVDRCAGSGSAPSCLLEPQDFQDVLPSPEITWGGTQADNYAVGSPFEASAQVVLTPLVANLDDDNGDGLIDERDFPEIIFTTYCNSEFTKNGVLRAIHGGGPKKGQDYFASCGTTVWHAGDDLAMACDCVEAIVNSTAVPAVGDLDQDGVPEIVAIREGKSVRQLLIYDNRGELLSASGNFSTEGKNPAVTLANIDTHRLAEVVVGHTVFTLTHGVGGELRVQDIFEGSSTEGSQTQGPIACVANLLGDARLEIIGGSAVYSLPRPPSGASTQADCAIFPPQNDEQTAFCAGELQIEWDGGIDGFCAVADVLGAAQDAPPGRDNPLDGVPELVLVTGGRVKVFNGQDGTLRVNRLLSSLDGARGGAPNIDDFDGDGFPEIGTAFATQYTLIDLQQETAECPVWDDVVPEPDDGSVVPPARIPPAVTCSSDDDCGDASSGFACNEQTHGCVCLHNGWRRETEDDSSRVTGSSVFDFNGDGAAEVIYNDECGFRVYDGLDGATLFAEPSESRTRIEYPVVADVDNDGNAEIVFGVSNESGFCDGDTPEIEAQYNNGLEVWGDASDTWVSARRIWSQHAYHVTNVTEGGLIPVIEPMGWLPTNGREYNTYRSNPRSLGIAPDLRIERIQASAPGGGCGALVSEANVAFKVANVGDLRVGPGVEIALRGQWGGGAFEPLLDGTGAPLTVVVGNTLEPGDRVFLDVDYDSADNGHGQLPDRIEVEADSQDQERECDETNNSAQAELDFSEQLQAELRLALEPPVACNALPVVTVELTNDGAVDVGGVTVRFYAGDPAQGGTAVHDEYVEQTLSAQGGTLTLDVTLSAFPQCVPVRIHAVVDPDDVIPECNDGNNGAAHLSETDCCNAQCGDSVRNGAEPCDGTDLGNETCDSRGFDGGDLACLPNCTFDESGCTTCADGVREGDEACDGDDLGGETCQSLGYGPGGELRCDASCERFDTSGCFVATCGDGVINGASEQCDGEDLGTLTCVDLGYDEGTAGPCLSNCTLDTSGCSECGDAEQGGSEACDGDDLGELSCVDLDFDGGTLRCNIQCELDTRDCRRCGDGVRVDPEVCDGDDLNGARCVDFTGFVGGSLACEETCDGYDTTGCVECLGCSECGGQACIDGVCGACVDSSECCAPLLCVGGVCRLF